MRNMLGIIFGGLISVFWFVSGALLATMLITSKPAKDGTDKRSKYTSYWKNQN